MMRLRYFRTADGWISPVVTSDPEFTVPIERHEESFSEAYGTPVMGVEIAEGEPDPRNGDLIPEPPVVPGPSQPVDVQAFKAAALDALGLPVSVALTAAGYLPLFTEAINARNWTLARQIVGYAEQEGALTAEQGATLTDLMDEYGIA